MNQTPIKTPLYETMAAAGGRMVDFHGWLLPMQFSGIMAEHKAVRENCGIFDVSHMGQVFIEGPDAHRLLQYTNANKIPDIPGRGVYSHVTNEKAGLVDDVIAFCLARDSFLVIVNAATTLKDFEWFRKQAAGMNVRVENKSPQYGMIAFQGPKALGVMKDWIAETAAMPRFGIIRTTLFGEPAFVMRTGYTGENGVEIVIANHAAPQVWNELMARGKDCGILPCGLGSRDTLRLEAGLLLYGQDVDDDHTTYEANYGWVVKLDKGDFIGKEILVKQKQEGVCRRLTGFILRGGGVPRADCKVYLDGRQIAVLTSATFAPSLGKGIGVGYASPADLEHGTAVEIEIRGARVPAAVCRASFYKSPYLK